MDPRWVIPIDPQLIEMAAQADMVVVYEDGVIRGGVGSALAEALSSAEVDTPLRQLAFPDIFPMHASRSEILRDYGLDPASAAQQLRDWASAMRD